MLGDVAASLLSSLAGKDVYKWCWKELQFIFKTCWLRRLSAKLQKSHVQVMMKKLDRLYKLDKPIHPLSRNCSDCFVFLSLCTICIPSLAASMCLVYLLILLLFAVCSNNVYLSIHLSIGRWSVHPYIRQSNQPSIHPVIHLLPVCIYLSVPYHLLHTAYQHAFVHTGSLFHRVKSHPYDACTFRWPKQLLISRKSARQLDIRSTALQRNTRHWQVLVNINNNENKWRVLATSKNGIACIHRALECIFTGDASSPRSGLTERARVCPLGAGTASWLLHSKRVVLIT